MKRAVGVGQFDYTVDAPESGGRTRVEVTAEQIRAQVRGALDEDVGAGDLTAALIPANATARATVIARERAVLCGREWFDAAFAEIDADVRVTWHKLDGERLSPGEVLCELSGPARALLTGERTALNFLQLLSGTATATRAYAEAVDGTGARVLDTRKTIPGLRMAQKYAVRCGGGTNHRMGLFDALLIKENHIVSAGSISDAVRAGKASGKPVEVEVEDLDGLREAMAAGADRVLLDNFDLHTMREAARVANGSIELEASGNVTLQGIREIAETGVDYISVGAITKNVKAVDFSMRFNQGKEQR